MLLGIFIGIIIGLLLAVLFVATLAYFKKTVERHIERIVKVAETAGPQPRGFIVEPDDEATEARQEIIEKNKRQGKDTKLSELL